MFRNLKPKSMERDNKIEVPSKLEKVNASGKPAIEFNLSDQLNKLVLWFRSTSKSMINYSLSKIVPKWVWACLLVIIVIFLTIVLVGITP